jgi:hypothetical protein
MIGRPLRDPRTGRAGRGVTAIGLIERRRAEHWQTGTSRPPRAQPARASPGAAPTRRLSPSCQALRGRALIEQLAHPPHGRAGPAPRAMARATSKHTVSFFGITRSSSTAGRGPVSDQEYSTRTPPTCCRCWRVLSDRSCGCSSPQRLWRPWKGVLEAANRYCARAPTGRSCLMTISCLAVCGFPRPWSIYGWL